MSPPRFALLRSLITPPSKIPRASRPHVARITSGGAAKRPRPTASSTCPGMYPRCLSSRSREGDTASTAAAVPPMDRQELFQSLGLVAFDEDEIRRAVHAVCVHRGRAADGVRDGRDRGDAVPALDAAALRAYLTRRYLSEAEDAAAAVGGNARLDVGGAERYAAARAPRMLAALRRPDADPSAPADIVPEEAVRQIVHLARSVHTSRVYPVAGSMLLTGASVGVLGPVMPFFVELVGLTPTEFGMVIGAFGAAKLIGNVPAAVLVERHGRKPYLVHSLSLIAIGSAGMGLATGLDQLLLCRLATGLGVSALTTAATLTVADLSTPLNRAVTMAPVMAAFAAGTALGPAIGGLLADAVGVRETFYVVGASYLCLSGLNHVLLTETRRPLRLYVPPAVADEGPDGGPDAPARRTVLRAFSDALAQWGPLWAEPRVRNVLAMNGLYWVSIAGSQMTVLPLLLTDPDGLALTAAGVGQMYMGMSMVQVFGNQAAARVVDSCGRTPAIVGGCSLIAAGMVGVPASCCAGDMTWLSVALGTWALGGTLLSTAPVAYLTDVVGDESRAQALALLRTTGDVGYLSGAVLSGLVAEWAGMEMSMQAGAGMLAVSAGWFGLRQTLDQRARESLLKKKG